MYIGIKNSFHRLNNQLHSLSSTYTININDTASLPVDATLTPSVPHEFHHRHQSTAAPNCVADALITSVLHQRPRELGCRSGPTTSAVARPGALRRGVRDGAAGRCGRCGRRGRREAAGAGVAGRGTVGGSPVAAGLGAHRSDL